MKQESVNKNKNDACHTVVNVKFQKQHFLCVKATTLPEFQLDQGPGKVSPKTPRLTTSTAQTLPRLAELLSPQNHLPRGKI